MGHQLLVIDDDAEIQSMLRTALEYEHFAVMTADDGLGGLECLNRVRPDLILLDLMMPKMDGSAFIKELERRGLRSSIPVIVLSADIYAKPLIERMHVESWLVKPFSLTELLRQIRALLGGYEAVSVSI